MLKIFNEEKVCGDVYLKLTEVESMRGVSIMLVACDIHGKRLKQGSLLLINKYGVYRHKDIDPCLGIDLDDKGCLRLDRE